MSDLKHQTLKQLEKSKAETENRILNLKTQLSGEQERLKWIEHYIYKNTAKEMTFEEIERALGHKVIIK